MHQIQRTALRLLLLLAANGLLCYLHIKLFHTSEPFLSWLSMGVHLVILVALPWARILGRDGEK